MVEGARVSVAPVGGYRDDIRESRVESSDGVERGAVSLVENTLQALRGGDGK